MPYSGPKDEKIPDHVPDDKKAQWVKVWNSTYASCIDDGGSEGTCETKAFKSANGAIKRSGVMERGFLKSFNKFVGDLKDAISGLQQRAVSISSIGNDVFEQFYNEGAWLNDLYYEGGEIFAVASQGGKLFRSEITIDESTGDIVLGEMAEVVAKFDPVNRTSFRTTEDGKVKMLAVSATSVINRNGQIDSRDLFDSMINYMTRTGKTIPRTFFHLGTQFRTGEITDLFRDDNVLMSITEFDDSEFAKREIATREKEPEYWGDSIEFDPVGDPELHDVGDGITIPVYRSGIPIAVSTVPADMASSHYANRFSFQEQEVKRMTLEDVQKQALVDKFFDGDEFEADGWLENNVSLINRQIADTGQVTRDTTEDETEEESTEEPVEEPSGELEAEEEISEEESEDEPEEEPEVEPAGDEEVIVEFDDEMAQEVAETVLKHSVFEDFRAEITEAVGSVQSSLETLTTTVGELQAASVTRTKEIADLKKSDAAKQKDWIDDLPRNTRTVKLHRPSTDATDEEPEESSMEEIAADTLANIAQ